MNNDAPITGGRLSLITIALSLGIFMNVLDASIANVAIPSIAGELGVSADQGTWVITSFAVSQAIMLPITGWLARRFGEVRLFVLSTLLFTIASVLCGLAVNLPMLVFFRVIQGAVSGPMIPLSQSILLSIYPDERKSFATAIWTMTAVVGPICGPIFGGFLTDYYSWPWIFYINLPVGLAASLITWAMLSGRETTRSRSPVDVVGLIFLAVGVGSLQILLDNGHDLDWFRSNVIVTLGVISFITLTFLVIWELTAKHPIVDLALFSLRNFWIGTVSLTLGYLVYFSNVVIFPLWLQTQMGYTATWAGLAAAPVGILPFFLTPLVGLILNRVDLRLITSLGFLVFAFSSFWMSSFNTSVNFQHLIEPRIIQGLGIAFFFAPLTSIVLSGLPQERTASALGLVNFCRILGGSFGTSISVDLWNKRETLHQSNVVNYLIPTNAIYNHTLGLLTHLGFTPTQANAVVQESVIHQAFMLATNDMFWLSGMLFVALLFILWLAKPPFSQARQLSE